VKGGAAGGGYAQVVPMEDINLHFTGDSTPSPVPTTALGDADAHLHNGNALGIDVRRVIWPRTIDMTTGPAQHHRGAGWRERRPAREDRFVIVPGSEIMAILALTTGIDDLETRLARIIVGLRGDKSAVRASDLKAHGAMTLCSKTPSIRIWYRRSKATRARALRAVRNIAHGCNSVLATQLVSRWATSCSPKPASARTSALRSSWTSSAASRPQAGGGDHRRDVRALKMHGGLKKDQLGTPDPGAVQRVLRTCAATFVT